MFKIKDRVKVKSQDTMYFDKVGIVTDIAEPGPEEDDNYNIGINFEGDREALSPTYFRECELSLLEKGE